MNIESKEMKRERGFLVSHRLDVDICEITVRMGLRISYRIWGMFDVVNGSALVPRDA